MSNSKNFMSIRSKLLAAIAMLLVASFMVVSSTYAWFTLSTAPEVTGITTQIGANGNLEIALYTGNTVQNSVGAANWVEKNASWGNIISLDDASYGLSNIVMKPSTLHVKDENGKIIIQTDNPLITPVYGSDGRIERLASNGFYGKYDTTSKGFVKTDVTTNKATSGYGVRALGTVSSMTSQQLLYANASTEVKTALSSAATLATKSLQDNGEGLVNLILKGASGGTSFTTNDDPETEATETNELAALDAMIKALGAVPAKLEDAVKNYLLLQLAYATSQLEDVVFETLVETFESEWETNFAALVGTTETPAATSITLTLPDGFSLPANVTLPADVTISGNSIVIPVGPAVVAYMADYNEIVTVIGAASTAYTTATAGETATFDQVKLVLTNLMDIEEITINGKKYADISAMKNGDNFDELVTWGSSVLVQGVSIFMPTGSGVYADIASMTKDFNAGFVVTRVEVSMGNMTVGQNQVYVNMYTATGATKALNPSLVLEPAGREADANAVISDSYAYVLDFAFRTNAAGSNLLLQQEATDRIYGDNGANSQTMGGGSYMSFDVLAGSGFTATDVQSLMSHIRLVFVDTETNTILTGATLGTGVVNSDGNNVKAPIVLCDVSIDEKGYLAFADPDFTDDQVITSLAQNAETHISVYVYFDGVTADNSAVAAIDDFSARGKLNLQFASSADLKPMDYSDLKTPAETTAAPNA